MITTRKDHKCLGCEEIIPKKTKAVYQTGKTDDDFFRYHLHVECNQFMIKHKDHLENGVWSGCVNDIKKIVERLEAIVK
jgi:hypothetical protein